MEKSVKIIQQLPLQERNYTDRNGQNQVFASKGYLLTDGVDSFYAEMQGDLARNYKDINFDANDLHRVQTVICFREYRDKDNTIRYSNEIRIVKMQ